MTQNQCPGVCTCQTGCETPEAQAVPTARTVTAGDVCGSVCVPEILEDDPVYAVINFPFQTYRTGFCPAEALCKGTLFPELVSPYTRGC